MIRMQHLQEHILESLKPYYQKDETPDVFPAKFSIEGGMYYFFTFAPAAEQLIMKEDGSVPKYNEIKHINLLATDYNYSIEFLLNIGSKWANISFLDNYVRFQKILNEIEVTLPADLSILREDILILKTTVSKIIEYHHQTVDLVKIMISAWDTMKKTELVTEEDQKEMRNNRFKLAQIQFKQNELQINTEIERMNVFNYLSSKKGLVHLKMWSLYLKFKPYQRKMLTSNQIVELEETRAILLKGQLPLEEEENTVDILAHLRNPK